jgi:hypothetical protein
MGSMIHRDGTPRHTRVMPRSRYSAAGALAPRLAAHFAPHACAPDAAAIEDLVDAAFWASLQREEGAAPEISLAFLPPERAVRPLRLARPLPLSPRALARLAPAVYRPGIHLGVWRDAGGLVVWGTTRVVASLGFVLEVIGPGLLVVKHRTGEESAKFRNVAVFEGQHVKFLTRAPGAAADHHPLLRTLVTPGPDEPPDDGDDVLLRLAVSMRAHRRGGTLLVVPAGSDAWRESIVAPLTYAVEPPFSELADIVRAPEGSRATGALERVVDAVAGLTAVDGATVVDDRFQLLAFGAKIARPDGRPRVESVALSEPVEGGSAVEVAVGSVGGTRHASAAQFAQDQPDALALVASQDGRFTAFAWCASRGVVHAHRIEALLL